MRFAALAGLLLLGGCGYQTGSMMPDGVRSVAVELFKDDTRVETRYRGAEVTYTLAASVLSLAQISLGAGQPDNAREYARAPPDRYCSHGPKCLQAFVPWQ